MEDSTYFDQSRTLLSNGRIQECINLLKVNISDSDLLDQIFQLEIRNNNLRRKVNAGTINQNDSQLEENRISNSLLLIISNLAQGKKVIIDDTTPPKKIDFKWLLIGLLGVSLIALAAYSFSDSGDTDDLTPQNPCDEITCLNDGVCESGKCLCPEGYEGARCETRIVIREPSDPCEGVRCQNNGTCENGKCKCPAGYTGTNCQTRVTTPPTLQKADLIISAFQMKPQPPVQGKKVYMQAIVKNVGDAKSGNFNINWWAGVNFPKPAFQKSFSGLGAGEQKIFSFQYDGYRSWYGTITSKLEVDPNGAVNESNENNNVLEKSYPVKRSN